MLRNILHCDRKNFCAGIESILSPVLKEKMIHQRFGKDSIRNGVLCRKLKPLSTKAEITIFLFDEENGKCFFKTETKQRGLKN